MENNKKLLLFGLGFVILSIFIVSIISIIVTNKSENSNLENNIDTKSYKTSMIINVYYYDKISNTLSYEERNISISDNLFVEDIFKQMKAIPKSTTLKSVIPESLNLIDFNLDGSNLTINLSSDYNSLSDSEKLIFRAGFVWTITEIDSIVNVKFLVNNYELSYANNKNMGYLNRDNIVLNPALSPDKIEQEKITLYFANKDNMLVTEERNIEAKQNQSMEMPIVAELINGPKIEGNLKTVPSETKIRNIKTEDAICYVDLSSDFITKLSGNKNQEILAIYSIVNSLTNLSNVNKVQFLIEGEKTSFSKESIDISQPLGRYEDIIQNDN